MYITDIYSCCSLHIASAAEPWIKYKCDDINLYERIQLFIVAAAHLLAA
jgi:hypothetical protein